MGFKRHETDRIFAERLNAGRPVSAHDLFGERANRCLRDNLISMDALRNYQRYEYHARVKADGKEAAVRWLSEKCPALFNEMFKKGGTT